MVHVWSATPVHARAQRGCGWPESACEGQTRGILGTSVPCAVAGRHGAVPRPLEGHEGAPLHLGRKLRGIVEHEVEYRGMGLEQEVRGDGRLDLSGRALGKARLRMRPNIRVRPAIEAAVLHPD